MKCSSCLLVLVCTALSIAACSTNPVTGKQEGREANTYHGLFSTHPDNDARFQEVVAAANKYKKDSATLVGRDSFLRALDGMTYGTSAREGVVRDNNFYHAPLDFSVSFPKGWRIENKPEKIIAIPRSNDGLIQLSMADLNKRITPRQFMTDRLQLKNMRDGRTFSSNGLDGYTAIASPKTPWGTQPVRYAVVYRGNSAYIFAAAAKQQTLLDRYGSATLETAKSLHSLTSAEKNWPRSAGWRLSVRPPACVLPSWPGIHRSPITRKNSCAC